MIHINQIGYKPGYRKKFLLNNSEDRFDSFQIFSLENEQLVYKGFLKSSKYDQDSGEILSEGDFSDFNLEGNYYIKVGQIKSFSFSIKEDIYKDLKNALLKLMYFQRCGTELKEQYAGLWKHQACHLKDAFLFENPELKINTVGGWHDAGDYGKYVVPAAKTIADLLLSYLFFPDSFQDKINIPESEEDIPDILAESLWGLKWLLKMQNENNGGVYHKVTSKYFLGMIMPEEASKESRYVFPISSTATACFAAVMAMASSIYCEYNQELANSMLRAAEKAWQWLEDNPVAEPFENPQGVITGGYGDQDDRDERYWAAIELYKRTSNKKYHQYIINNYLEDFDKVSVDWRNVGGYGTISYLFMKAQKQDQQVREYLEEQFFESINKMLERADKSVYGLSIDKYIWGSNGLLMDQSLLLIIASFLKKEKGKLYIKVARNNFDYLLGCNVLDQSYVTGYGSKQVLNPHHRPSEADGVDAPIPGMVSGGPNQNLQDQALKDAVAKDVPPARAFVDHLGSHSSNEITTYWKSPAIFTAAYFDYFKQEG